MNNDKREQQIWDEACHRYADSKMRIAFVAAARWADSHPAWTPVDKELPEKEEYNQSLSVNVIVTDGSSVFESYYSFNTHTWAGTEIYGTITHWMPLPAPPQGKEDKK